MRATSPPKKGHRTSDCFRLPVSIGRRGVKRRPASNAVRAAAWCTRPRSHLRLGTRPTAIRANLGCRAPRAPRPGVDRRPRPRRAPAPTWTTSGPSTRPKSRALTAPRSAFPHTALRASKSLSPSGPQVVTGSAGAGSEGAQGLGISAIAAAFAEDDIAVPTLITDSAKIFLEGWRHRTLTATRLPAAIAVQPSS